MPRSSSDTRAPGGTASTSGLWLGLAATAAGLWLSWTAPWDDGNDRWKLVAAQSSVTYGQVIATGGHDAWAFGWDIVGIGAWLPMADGPHRPTVFHWDGDHWTRSDFPIERGNIGSDVPPPATGPGFRRAAN
ncbi:hypothetical protein [Nonomuraea helvata]|uniref:DUF2510 domain-containing protein n=1 Tax=Nonomuraea helvata TaxID=37484 RepID=A0ABV5SIP6_9ACTN